MTLPAASINIRTFAPADAAACQKLYHEGLIGGKIADNDTGIDIDNIEQAYIKTPGNHFWVAESDGKVVGMIGVMASEGLGEIRRLRVAKDYRRRGIGSALLEAATHFCQENHYLKVTLDTFVEREDAIRLFEKNRFRHSRTKTIGGKDLLYFYLDLYTSDRSASNE